MYYDITKDNLFVWFFINSMCVNKLAEIIFLLTVSLDTFDSQHPPSKMLDKKGWVFVIRTICRIQNIEALELDMTSWLIGSGLFVAHSAGVVEFTDCISVEG